jgi:1-phosphofructokinase
MTDIIKVAHQLRDKGIAHVVISLGERGALWVNASGAWLANPPHCDVISTVGAGDSMVAGLVYGLLMSQTSEHTLRLATAISALSVSQPDVGIKDRSQIAQMMTKIELTPIK